MVARALALIALVAPAAAFVPASGRPAARAPTSVRAGIDIEHPAAFAETGGAVWDPMGLSDLGSEETVKWFRACELKHGRIAMMATLGWVHQSFGAFGGGLYFPTADG